jgi:flagellar motor switch protein FliG
MPSAYAKRNEKPDRQQSNALTEAVAMLAGRPTDRTARELRELSIVMSTLGTIGAPEVEALLLEFVSRMSASGALMGNYDSTEQLLKQYLPPERVSGIMDEIRGPAGRNMWEKLSNVQEQVLANYLKNEYPQTVAVVLSKIRPEHAARVLAILPEELALDVVNRMLKMEAVQKEVIERVENTLRTEFMSRRTTGTAPSASRP